jgi:hypothetical protein
MKVYQLLDVDSEPVGLLKVEVPLTGSYEERQKLQDNMDIAVQAICQNEYQTDFEGADELIDTIAEKLGELGYEAERFYLEVIYMV